MNTNTVREFENDMKAWGWIHCNYPKTQWYLDHESSEKAGYNIYRDTEEFYNYVCDLGDRLELNLKEGNQTINLWVAVKSYSEVGEATEPYDLSKRELDIICSSIYTVVSATAATDNASKTYKHVDDIMEYLTLLQKLRNPRKEGNVGEKTVKTNSDI